MMSTRSDIDGFVYGFATIGVTPMEYSYWVESKIMTAEHERLVENVLGLVGEAGEIAEKVKKSVRDKVPLNRADMIKELGDVSFYVAALANHLESNLAEVLETNMNKLNDREARGVLGGNGDNR